MWLNDSRSVGIVPQRFVWRASDQFKQSSSESSQELGDWSPKGNTEDSQIRALTVYNCIYHFQAGLFPHDHFQFFNLASFRWGPSGTSQIAAVIRGQGCQGHPRGSSQLSSQLCHSFPSQERDPIRGVLSPSLSERRKMEDFPTRVSPSPGLQWHSWSSELKKTRISQTWFRSWNHWISWSFSKIICFDMWVWINTY